MVGRNGQTMLGTYVPVELASRFKAWARGTHGGASASLRDLITQAIDGQPAPAPAGKAAGYQVMVRLKESERLALLEAARSRGTTPANWLRSLAITHLGRRPQWSPAEVDALRELFGEVRRIGNNVNQIARAINTAAHSGDYPPYQGEAAREAAELIRIEMRRIVAVMTGNFDYWGLPDAERPSAAPGAAERDEAAAGRERKRRTLRPRRRPKPFADD